MSCNQAKRLAEMPGIRDDGSIGAKKRYFHIERENTAVIRNSAAALSTHFCPAQY